MKKNIKKVKKNLVIKKKAVPLYRNQKTNKLNDNKISTLWNQQFSSELFIFL